MITKELQNMRPLKGNERLERDSEYMGADDIVTGTEPVLGDAFPRERGKERADVCGRNCHWHSGGAPDDCQQHEPANAEETV